MKDRQPTNAGRVQLVPVAGQTNIYDMTMADGATEQGTALNKANLLSDATAELFNMSENATPNSVFSWLGKFNAYWWKRRIMVGHYEPDYTNISSNVEMFNVTLGTQIALTYAFSVSFDAQGGVIFDNPVTEEMSATYVDTFIVDNAPLYAKTSSMTEWLYFPKGTTSGSSSSTIYESTISSGKKLTANVDATSSKRAKTVGSVWTEEPGDVELVYSKDRDAYPDSGIVDGYEYEYLGVPFENLPTAPKIETGSYIGTGTYGESSPNSLTFSFVPKAIMVFRCSTRNINHQGSLVRSDANDNYFFQLMSLMTTEFIGGRGFGGYSNNRPYGKKSDDGKTVSWYQADSGEYQMNSLNEEYGYIVIG